MCGVLCVCVCGEHAVFVCIGRVCTLCVCVCVCVGCVHAFVGVCVCAFVEGACTYVCVCVYVCVEGVCTPCVYVAF